MKYQSFQEMRKKVGDISQIAGIKAFEFSNGRAKGTSAYEVYNASGLCFTVLPDKCMDILDLRYKGTNIGFITKNGLVANKFFNALDNEFLYYWTAGMMYTCGLANTGPSCEDGGLYRTEHGRIGCTPATNVCAESVFEDDDYRMRVSGEMRESMVYGSNLSLKRRIETSMFAKEICIHDTVTNLEPADEEFMLLYHFNFGYPLVNEGARIVKPNGFVTPRTPEAAKGLQDCCNVTPPVDNSDEECFFHGQSADGDGFAYVGLINDHLGLGAYLKYSLDTLPVLVEWKSPRSHDYCIGLEPGNSYIMGRALEREKGTLQKITGYGQIEYTLTLGLLDGAEEIKSFEEKIKLIKL